MQLKEGAADGVGLLAAVALATVVEKLAAMVHATSLESPVAVFPAAHPPTFDDLAS